MNRREFLHSGMVGTAALAVASPLALFPGRALAAAPTILKAVRRTIEVNGKAASVFGLIGPDGKPGLTFLPGQNFNVQLNNELGEPTIIHWHGLTPPWASDGVADAPMPMIAGGASRDFDFPLSNGGTHWMHAHTLQEQALLAAPLIVRTKEDVARDEQEVVILLHDFSFTPAEELLARLQKGGGHVMAGHGAKPAQDQATMGHSMPGHTMPSQSPAGDGGMAMDINDIEYDAYLANDRDLTDPEVVAVERGGRVRLRIINGATATAFTVDLGALEGQLVAVDGEDLAKAVPGRRFPLAMGQRADIRVQLPKGNGAFPILALREGAREQTGVILRTKDAPISKIAKEARAVAPVLDLALEKRLRSVRSLAVKEPNKRFHVVLDGTMENYSWSMDVDKPVLVRQGDRVEITMHNKSMMSHPMHMHGHHFQVVAIDGKRFSGARRDTVNIPIGHAVTIAVDADNPGKWAFHCHHLYHMVAGMMRSFDYEA